MDFKEEHTPILKENLSVGHLSVCIVSSHTDTCLYIL